MGTDELWESVEHQARRHATWEVRCGVCRRRDLYRGGPGRADRLGVVSVGVDGRSLRVTWWRKLSTGTTTRTTAGYRSPIGRPAPLTQDARGRTIIEGPLGPGGGDPLPGEHPEPYERARVVEGGAFGDGYPPRCRRSHRLRADVAEALEQIARGYDVVYLDAA